MISIRRKFGWVVALFYVSASGVWGQECPTEYPFVDKVENLDVLSNLAYISIGASVLEYADGQVPPPPLGPKDPPYFVGLNREFVSCFSRVFQEADEVADKPIFTLVRQASEIAPNARVSGWGFEYNGKAKDLLEMLADLANQKMSSFTRNRLRACMSHEPKYFQLTGIRKIDPSVSLRATETKFADAEVLLTRYSDRECTPKGAFSRISFGGENEVRAFLRVNVAPIANAPDRICRVAQNPCIRSIERFPVIDLRESHTHSSATPSLSAPCKIRPKRVDFDGSGQVAGVIDVPIDYSHCAFEDSVPPGDTHRKIAFDGGERRSDPPLETRYHGTIVAGLLAGDPPNMDPKVTGKAPKAKIAFSRLDSFESETLTQALRDEYAHHARVFSMSWGDDRCPVKISRSGSGGDKYEADKENVEEEPCLLGPLTRVFDNFAGDHEDALIIAADSNGDRVGMPENGRNVIAVAASGSSGRQCTRFLGARGPTIIGQWKPDLLSQGCRVKAAIPGSGCKGDFAPPALDPEYSHPVPVDCATSWAAPNLAGKALQLREFLSRGCFLAGGCQGPEWCSPSGAQMKSLLIAAGTLPSGILAGPSEGWGFPNLGRVAVPAKRIFLVDVRNTDRKYALTDGSWVGPYGVALYDVDLNPNSGDTEVTLAWTEPGYGENVGLPIPVKLGLTVFAYHDAELVATLQSGCSTNTMERISIPKRANWLDIYVHAPRVVGTTLITGFQGYALSVSGAVAERQNGRQRKCETSMPLLPIWRAEGFPFGTDFAVPGGHGDARLVGGDAAPEGLHVVDLFFDR